VPSQNFLLPISGIKNNKQGGLMQGERSSKASLRAQFRWVSNDRELVEAAIRHELQILADIETQFENHCDGLDRSVLPRSMRAFALHHMRWRRRLRRMPHEASVRKLHQKLLGLLHSPDRLH
jgi:hypothetical protein